MNLVQLCITREVPARQHSPPYCVYQRAGTAILQSSDEHSSTHPITSTYLSPDAGSWLTEAKAGHSTVLYVLHYVLRGIHMGTGSFPGCYNLPKSLSGYWHRTKIAILILHQLESRFSSSSNLRPHLRQGIFNVNRVLLYHYGWSMDLLLSLPARSWSSMRRSGGRP
jgi:hypothetical protein